MLFCERFDLFVGDPFSQWDYWYFLSVGDRVSLLVAQPILKGQVSFWDACLFFRGLASLWVQWNLYVRSLITLFEMPCLHERGSLRHSLSLWPLTRICQRPGLSVGSKVSWWASKKSHKSQCPSVILCGKEGQLQPLKEGLFNRTNPQAIGMSSAKVVPPRRHNLSWRHHFRFGRPCNSSRLNSHW